MQPALVKVTALLLDSVEAPQGQKDTSVCVDAQQNDKNVPEMSKHKQS